MVALTFDDGPDPRWTPAVLDLLDAVAVTATFFVVAEQIEDADGPPLLRDMLARGHSVQMHCGAHVSHRELDRDALHRDAERIEGALASNGVAAPTLWRPPYGHVNEECSCRVARERGRRLVLWTHNTHDYTGATAESMLRTARRAPLHEHSVILMHDSRRYTQRTKDASQTLALIEPLIEHVRAQGWELGPLRDVVSDRPPRAGDDERPLPAERGAQLADPSRARR